VTPNERDNHTTAHGVGEEHSDGVSVTPESAAVPESGARPDANDEGQYDPYLTSGANPFSSVHPSGSGTFPRLQPRQFPPDEEPSGDVPVMEQLPDPNALPEPGYPVFAGYQQGFTGAQSAFPPGAFPSAFPAEASAFPVETSAFPVETSAFPSTDTTTFRASSDAQAAYQPHYPSEPYTSPRAPEEAPPLSGVPSGFGTDSAPGVTPPPLDTAPSAPARETPDYPVHTPPPPTLSAPPVQQGQPTQRQPVPGQPAQGQPAPSQPAQGQGQPPQNHAAYAPPRPPADPVFSDPVAPPRAPARETADSLTADSLLHGRRPLPSPGWRRTLYKATGGIVRVGESAADMHRRDLINLARTPVAGGHHRVAVMSLKGGVGKTTTAVGLGATLASLRGDRVIAMDANPDRGTLSDKVRLETSATVRDLLNERAQVTRYADVRAFTSQAPSRLEILASDRDPAVSVAFSADDYRSVARVLEHYYSICITDCGTGLLHSAMSGILELADHIVLVSSPSVDGARSASATLDWLEAHGYGDLVRGAVVVLSSIRPRSKSTVDLDRLEQHFAARCRAVVRIPYDAHLEEGAEVELELLNAETADAYLELGALVGEGFAVPRRPVTRHAPGAPLA
jgi:MinD-like ATPase involved in chromosome partitioning or flagellar assembly